MKKIVFLVMLWMVSIGTTWADNVEFTTHAPDVVVNGEQFRLTFTVNTMNVKEFRAPSITNFFLKLYYLHLCIGCYKGRDF